ncbi:sensor histidine kinase [Dyadobacter sp. CY312]|uniref:sensor histidine kinase n=1 Tax=Dyadobacter sp. CY312 TaxID=2907303 RepID=UPI001F3A60AF|nr:histidine kinase [Dyadobacter sp. CY312]MCE7042899.1 histidine kinase [Dyadobacter sp. CY312]
MLDQSSLLIVFKVSLLTMLFVCGSYFSFATRPNDSLQIPFVYNQPVESEDIVSVMELLKLRHFALNADSKHFEPRTSVWIFLNSETAFADTSKKFIITSYQDYIDLYERSYGTWKKVRTGGKFVNKRLRSPTTGRYFIQLPQKSNDPQQAFLIVCRKFTDYNFGALEFSLKSDSERKEWEVAYRLANEGYAKFMLPFFGIFFITILFLLVKFFLLSDLAYAFHAFGVLLFMAFFVLVYYEYPINIDSFFVEEPSILLHFDKLFLFLSLGCLLASVRIFLTEGKWVKLNNRVTGKLTIFSVCIAFSSALISYFEQEYYVINGVCIICATLIMVIFAVHLFRIREEIMGSFGIIVKGIAFLSTSSSVGFVLAFFASDSKWGLGREILLAVPMLIGVGLYNCFIIVALVNREYQIQQRGIDLKAKVFEAELVVVQRGLNPHFIFNCLNLIDSFLYSNNVKAARKVLYDFSDLLRLVIDKSPNQLILLVEEFKMLELYMILEKSRSSNCFEYYIDIEKGLDISGMQVPPLIIQPIVENAIKHGILNRLTPGGEIRIRIIKKSDKQLEIEVDDNGVGRRVAKQLRQVSYFQSGHVGISLTRKRLEIMAEVFKTESFLEIIDKPDDYAGTTVKIFLPILRSIEHGNSLYY